MNNPTPQTREESLGIFGLKMDPEGNLTALYKTRKTTFRFGPGGIMIVDKTETTEEWRKVVDNKETKPVIVHSV